jgi:hypothetical protein
VKGQPMHYDTKQMPAKELLDKKTNSFKSQKQQEQKAKLLDQRNVISQMIQKKNNK